MTSMISPLLTETFVAIYTDECVAIYHPETGVRSIDNFVHRVDKLSDPYIKNKGEVSQDDDLANKFKGDMLEVFSEIFFDAHRNDTIVGIHNYMPVPLSEDYGVDALGINVAGNPVVIQCKFRSNPSDAITYEDMAKTYTAGRKRHHITLEADDTVILLTTCNSVSKACKEVFCSQLRLISKNIIAQRVDNNVAFWEEAEQRVALTLQKLGLL
jgi:hypothetical protein